MIQITTIPMAVKKQSRIQESKPAKFPGVVRLEENCRPNFHNTEFNV
jgi:hypothetical protein